MAMRLGNSNGNVVNRGIAAIMGDWIYYRNSGDGGNLYKEHIETNEKVKLSNDQVLYINVADEKWVYYYGLSSSYSEGLFRVRTNGSRKEKIAIGGHRNVIVVDEWIYGIYDESSMSVAPSKNQKSGLYKMDTDGNATVLVNDEHIYQFVVYDGWIYFNYGKNNTNYRMSMDGTDLTKVNDEKYGSWAVYDSWVYFSNRDNKLYKMRLDGSSKQTLCDDAADYINVEDEWVYYFNRNDGKTLHKIRINGQGRIKLANGEGRNVNLVGDWMFLESGNFILEAIPCGTNN